MSYSKKAYEMKSMFVFTSYECDGAEMDPERGIPPRGDGAWARLGLGL